MEEAIEELKKAKDGEDKEAIDKAMENLSQKAHKLAEEIYKEAQAAQQGGAQGGTKPEDDVAEAEVVNEGGIKRSRNRNHYRQCWNKFNG